MNKQQIKGAAREATGKMQKKVGKATANGTLAVKGTANELAGKAQKAVGNAQAGAKREMRNARERSRDRSIDRHAH